MDTENERKGYDNQDSANRRLARYVHELFDKSANARSNSGIESTWSDARDAFEGKYQKESPTEGERDKSQIFVQITRSKCIAALASIVAAIFQKVEMPYYIEASSIPDSINGYLEAIGINIEDNLDRMKGKIDDQITEANMRPKLVRAILNMIVYGTCCIQVPVTKNRTRTKYDVVYPDGVTVPTLEQIQQMPPEQQQQTIQSVQQIISQFGQFVMSKFEEYGPDMEVIRIWDAFPDPDMNSCDVQGGDWFIHRALITKLEFLNRIKQGHFDAESGMTAIKDNDGATATNVKGNDPAFDYANSEAKYQILTFTGKLSVKTLKEVLDNDSKARITDREDDDLVEAIIAVSGDEVLSAAIGIDQDGLRPFQLCVYEQVPESPWGRGVPQNIKDAQSLVNGLTRSLVEAKKLSSSLQTVIKPSSFAAGENGKVYPRKVWKLATHEEDVRKAIQWFTMPDSSGGTLEAISVFRSLADDHSGIPRILEGQSQGSASSRTTATEVSQLVSSANLQLENVIRNIDTFLIGNIVLGFYRWNMEMSDDMHIKGDFTIYPTGYESFKAKQERSAKIDMVLGGHAQDPQLRRMLNMEAIFRERLALDGLDEFMFDSQTIQDIIAQEQAQQQELMQQQAQMQAELEEQKFEQAVRKKGEVMATKEEIKKERDINDGIKEIEMGNMLRNLGAQAQVAKTSGQAAKIDEAVNKVKRATRKKK